MRTQDGKEYSVRPVADSRSLFDIAGVNLNLSADEIVALVREVRERYPMSGRAWTGQPASVRRMIVCSRSLLDAYDDSIPCPFSCLLRRSR